MDDIAGLQSGYTAKLEVGSKNLGPISLTCMLGALGVELLVVPKAVRHLPEQSKTVQPIDAEPARTAFEKLRQRYRDMGRRSGETRRARARNAPWHLEQLIGGPADEGDFAPPGLTEV